MSFNNCWMISSCDFQAHLQCSQRRCFSQTALMWFEVLPDLSPALPGAPKVVVGAPRVVVGAPSYSEGRQECPPRVWYSAEIDASMFTLHILSDTPWGFQCLKYIVLMCISKLARSQPPSASPISLDLSLQVYLQTRTITDSKFTRSWPPSPSPHSLHQSLQVYLQTRSITASECMC